MTICYSIKYKAAKTLIAKEIKKISSQKKTCIYLILWLQYKLREVERFKVRTILYAVTQQLYEVRAEYQP